VVKIQNIDQNIDHQQGSTTASSAPPPGDQGYWNKDLAAPAQAPYNGLWPIADAYVTLFSGIDGLEKDKHQIGFYAPP
jgi:hypothetical protein